MRQSWTEEHDCRVGRDWELVFGNLVRYVAGALLLVYDSVKSESAVGVGQRPALLTYLSPDLNVSSWHLFASD